MDEQRRMTHALPSEGEQWDVVGDRYRFLATTEATGGRYALIQALIPPGGGPPPHLHHREDEGFYILEGEIAFYTEGQRIVLSAGSFVNLPSGETHRFCNESDRAASVLILCAPGGLDQFFSKVGRKVTDPNSSPQPPSQADIQRLIEVAPEFGLELKIPSDHV